MKTITCITRKCDREQRSRGLCERCYINAHGLILGGRTTWEELEKMKLALPSTRIKKSKFRETFFTKFPDKRRLNEK